MKSVVAPLRPPPPRDTSLHSPQAPAGSAGKSQEVGPVRWPVGATALWVCALWGRTALCPQSGICVCSEMHTNAD